jgi:arabinan endo-1,5-alpha-L-arabinosidase
MYGHGLLFATLALVAVFGLAPAPAPGQTAGAARRAAATYTNPVLDADFPDPTVILAGDGWYYAYATQSTVAGRDVNIQVARSKDLVAWERVGDALPTKPAWASETQNFWAPDVSRRGDTYFMYFSAEPNTRDGMCIGVATSASPAGPFVDVGAPLLRGKGFAAIDPMAFDDPKTGKRLLYWGSGFEPIRVRELAPDRKHFLEGSEPRDLIAPSATAPYRKLVEGAWVTERAGTYYLFFSGDNCCGPGAHYAVMVARSKSATGPFELFPSSGGVILEKKDFWVAPGHNSVVRDAAGDDWIFYHAIDPRRPRPEGASDPGLSRRVMLADRLVYRGGWPRVERDRPSRGPVPRPKTR